MTIASPLTIPDAPGCPLVGNVRPMTTDIRRFLTEQYLRLGPVFRVSALQHRMTVLAGPEANALVQGEAGRLFSSGAVWKGLRKVFEMDNPSMIELDGPDHARLRGGLRAGYAGSSLYPQMPKLVAAQLRMMEEWPRGQPFAAFDRIKRLVSSLLGYMATNQAPDEAMDDLIYFFRVMIQIHIQKTRPSLLQYLPRYVRTRRSVLNMARRIWDEQGERACLDAKGNFVDLVRQFQAENPDLMTERDAVAAIQGPFIAGLDTAASATSFLLYHILRDPGLKAAIVAEADQAFAAGLPDRASLRHMVKTRWAAMEVLRMYPPAPALSRYAVTDFDFQGYRISAGTRCLIAHTVTHYLPEFFPRPEQFDVERYSPARKEHAQPHAYAPYGLGPHTCLGASTADLLYLIITAALFRHFRLDMQPPDQKLRLVMQPLPSPSAHFRVVVTGTRHAPPELGRVEAGSVAL